eukprot:1137298-Pelagomonas_calceolata.AAC.6
MQARTFLAAMPPKPPVPLEHKFPNADRGALALLQKLIAFDPSDRPSAAEALSDPYFAGLPSTTQVRAFALYSLRQVQLVITCLLVVGLKQVSSLSQLENPYSSQLLAPGLEFCQCVGAHSSQLFLQARAPNSCSVLHPTHLSYNRHSGSLADSTLLTSNLQEATPISQDHFDFELHKLDEAAVRNLIYQEGRRCWSPEAGQVVADLQNLQNWDVPGARLPGRQAATGCISSRFGAHARARCKAPVRQQAWRQLSPDRSNPGHEVVAMPAGSEVRAEALSPVVDPEGLERKCTSQGAQLAASGRVHTTPAHLPPFYQAIKIIWLAS